MFCFVFLRSCMRVAFVLWCFVFVFVFVSGVFPQFCYVVVYAYGFLSTEDWAQNSCSEVRSC